jgi:hypothetical protein
VPAVSAYPQCKNWLRFFIDADMTAFRIKLKSAIVFPGQMTQSDKSGVFDLFPTGVGIFSHCVADHFPEFVEFFPPEMAIITELLRPEKPRFVHLCSLQES